VAMECGAWRPEWHVACGPFVGQSDQSDPNQETRAQAHKKNETAEWNLTFDQTFGLKNIVPIRAA
jgi:hypothetical protein